MNEIRLRIDYLICMRAGVAFYLVRHYTNCAVLFFLFYYLILEMSNAVATTEINHYSQMTEAELIAEIMALPDAHCYPLPAKFYKKYGIKPAEAVSFRDYAESQIWLKRQIEDKDLPALEIKPEELPAEVKPYIVVDTVKVEVETKTTDVNTIVDSA